MSLINFIILLPDGGVVFWDVRDCSGVEKSAEDIEAWHIDIASEVTGGKPERVSHFIMDNPSVNRKAMRLLEARLPTVSGIGCQVRHV
jgi:hypothetical protein